MVATATGCVEVRLPGGPELAVVSTCGKGMGPTDEAEVLPRPAFLEKGEDSLDGIGRRGNYRTGGILDRRRLGCRLGALGKRRPGRRCRVVGRRRLSCRFRALGRRRLEHHDGRHHGRARFSARVRLVALVPSIGAAHCTEAYRWESPFSGSTATGAAFEETRPISG